MKTNLFYPLLRSGRLEFEEDYVHDRHFGCFDVSHWKNIELTRRIDSLMLRLYQI